MELSWLFIFKIGASLAGVIAGIGMFSELHWPVKLKVAAALLTGIILIGFLAWPLTAPAEPFGVISVPAIGAAIALLGLAVLAGFIGYFLSWPYGREIGILAAPAGLAVWAVRCGNMAELMQLNPTLAQRQQLFATLKWEPIFWLAVVAAGFGGVLIGQRLASPPAVRRPQAELGDPKRSPSSIVPRLSSILTRILAVVGSVLIAQLFIVIFAQDVRIGSVMAQPSGGQIIFAVLVSFGIAAFLVKKFLDAGCIWPIAASALLTGFAVITNIRQDTLRQLVERYPPAFFSSSVISILPLQMVAFGVLGSIAGYWLAVRADFRQKTPLKTT